MANTDEPNLINFSSVGEPSKVLMDKVGIKRRVSIDKTKKEVDNTTLIENLPLVSCSAASDQVDVPKQSQKKEEPEPPQHQNFIVNEPKRVQISRIVLDCFNLYAGNGNLIKSGRGMTVHLNKAKAMQDPEIQSILQDPVMRQENPRAAEEHAKNPMVMNKIQKLISAEIVQMR
ncbi:Heat shock protein STI [Glycine soja]|uniref:Heat shock protein STI n=1 Tax=Glycine soja TaxID=3848 RepID=A0A0B2RLY3_GLYSO|nr:Heat shock protein STI [Glycine soja]